jgi:hypothetical protein
MIEKKLAKISKVQFGYGGYQECCIGLSLTFESKSTGVGTFIGAWDPEIIKCDSFCKWTEKDRSEELVKLMRKVSKLLKQAKIEDIMDLKGKPVELELEGNCLKDWRILEEVL